MSKKPTKTKSRKQPRPQVAQLQAVERLLEAEDYTKAIRKLKPLVQGYPDHGGLRQLLVEALDNGEGPRAAGVAAFEWAERKPNSLPAQQVLLYFAVSLNHVFLAERVAGRVRELGQDTPGFPLEAEMLEAMLRLPDGTGARIQDMERFDIGKLYVDGHDFVAAARWLEGVDVLPARNNHALALFHLGRIEEALVASLTNWQVDADNLFALGWAVRLRLYQGDDAGAHGLTLPLAQATARRLDDALSQLDALLLLRQDEAAWAAFERARQTDWAGMEPGVSGALFHHYGACAASRLGNRKQAKRLWQEALKMEPDFRPAAENLDLPDEPAQSASFPSVFEFHQVIPMDWIKRLHARAKNTVSLFEELTAANRYLKALYIGGDKALRDLVGFALKYRAEHADEEAANRLKEFACLPIGTREERFGFLYFLREQNILTGNETVEIWDDGQCRQIRVTNTEIYREPKESGLPPDLEDLLGESISLYHEDRLDEAETRLNRILQRVPDHPVALGNLSALRSAQGRQSESHDLLRQVVEKHPDYLVARCNLATTLIVKGELEEAQRLLDGLMEHERMHIQEAFVLYGALAMLHKAKGEEEIARSLIASLESMVEDEDDERRLSRVKSLVDQADPAKRLKKMLQTVIGFGRAGDNRGR